jgi:16S rRNA (guanine527-N7)-methyltransferase
MQDTGDPRNLHPVLRIFVTDEPLISEYPTDLVTALCAAEIELTGEQVELLDRYRELLWNWNEQLNLTRHTTLEKFVTRDVVDSWELAKLLGKRQRVLDIGTGGGVPGLVLAICRPDLRVSVCESVLKKAKVVEAIVVELSLNVSVYACRAEEVLELQTFDTLVARGVAALAKILRWLEPHWNAFDRLLLIKGRKWVEERGEARHVGLLKKLELRKAATYLTPRTDAESVILSITRVKK